KQKTSKTADTYPLSLNSLTTGCNQKSNRDPVMSVSDDEVAEVLPSLQERGLAAKITGGRVDRWKHLLYEKWNISAAEMAVLAELLLRGPQRRKFRSRAASQRRAGRFQNDRVDARRGNTERSSGDAATGSHGVKAAIGGLITSPQRQQGRIALAGAAGL